MIPHLLTTHTLGTSREIQALLFKIFEASQSCQDVVT